MTDYLLTLLKFEIFVTVPTIVFDILIGLTNFRKFAVLLLENYDVPFWIDISVTLIFYTAIIASILFLSIRFIEYHTEDARVSKIISGLISPFLTFFVLLSTVFAALNFLSLYFATTLALVYGIWILPQKNIVINKEGLYQRFLKKYIYKNQLNT